MKSEHRPDKALATQPNRTIVKIVLACAAMACAWSPLLFAQSSPPLSKNPSKYAKQLPPRPPAGTYPEYRRPGSVSSVNDLFWEAIKEIETGYSHWNTSHLPKPGLADPQGVISIGLTQIRFDDGTAAQAARRAGLGWSFKEYVYNPVYNEKIGRNHFEYYGKSLDPAFHPCAAAAIYNWGIGNGQKWRDGAFSSTGTPYHWDKQTGPLGNKYYQAKVIAFARKKAAEYGMSEEIENTIRTTPGCLEVMADIDTSIMKRSDGAPRPALPVIGFCDPRAAKMITGAYEARQNDYDMTFEPLLRKIKSAPPSWNEGGGFTTWEKSVSDLSACTETSWPTMKITYPTMDQIIRGVAQEIVRRVCSNARYNVSQYESALKGRFYINTRIPGVPNAGIATGSGEGGAQIDPGG